MKNTTNYVLFAAMLMMVTIFSCSTGPDAVAKKFLAAQEKKDFKAMKELSTKESVQMIDMIETLSAKDTAKAKANTLTIKNTEIKDSTALVTYCCDAGAKDGGDSKLHMKKTAEGWKVDMSKETLMGGKNVMDMMKMDDKGTDATGGAADTTKAPAADTTKH